MEKVKKYFNREQDIKTHDRNGNEVNPLLIPQYDKMVQEMKETFEYLKTVPNNEFAINAISYGHKLTKIEADLITEFQFHQVMEIFDELHLLIQSKREDQQQITY